MNFFNLNRTNWEKNTIHCENGRTSKRNFIRGWITDDSCTFNKDFDLRSEKYVLLFNRIMYKNTLFCNDPSLIFMTNITFSSLRVVLKFNGIYYIVYIAQYTKMYLNQSQWCYNEMVTKYSLLLELELKEMMWMYEIYCRKKCQYFGWIWITAYY